ncbi:MAG: polysaccharide biosynthesis/export family protein [Pseudomonadota bacterium]
MRWHVMSMARSVRRHRPLLRALSIYSLMWLLAACSTSSGARFPGLDFFTFSQPASPMAHIVAHDRLKLVFWRRPERNCEARVKADGTIALAGMGPVIAHGKTPLELARALEDRLAGSSNAALKEQPEDFIVAVIKQSTSRAIQSPAAQSQVAPSYVRVVGATALAPHVPHRPEMTLLDVMIGVGGMAASGAGNDAILIRTDAQTGKQLEVALRVADLMQDGDLSANMLVEPNDVIFLPARMQ